MEQQLPKLPVGLQSFEDLRRNNYLYVDKTALMHELVTSSKYYFLSRPRRFGKSMLLSTFKAYFLGQKDLFKGLAIEKIEDEWIEYPVFYVDLNTATYSVKDSLAKKLSSLLDDWEAIYGKTSSNDDLGDRFERVIRSVYEKTGKQVVILVDEYDKPLLETINNQALQDYYRATLKGFYGALKSMDGCIKFAMLTGVTKFGKVSVFGDLNNLKDISLDRRYQYLCGVTEQELHQTLDPYVQNMADTLNLSVDEVYATLKKHYDGYHFVPGSDGVYNPFSLLSALDSQDFGSYWFDTGTPTYLVKLLKDQDYNLEQMSRKVVSQPVISSIDTSQMSPISVIFQSGYLTIKDYNKEFRLYTLGFPNEEVEEGFVSYLMPFYTPIASDDTAFEITSFVSEVRSGNVDAFMSRLQTFFYGTPYAVIKNTENYYQNVLFIVCRLSGLYTKAELMTANGRIDMTIETADYVYIFEFKLDGTSEMAMEQILETNYTGPFRLSGKKIVGIGVNFSSEKRNIDRWIVKKL